MTSRKVVDKFDFVVKYVEGCGVVTRIAGVDIKDESLALRILISRRLLVKDDLAVRYVDCRGVVLRLVEGSGGGYRQRGLKDEEEGEADQERLRRMLRKMTGS